MISARSLFCASAIVSLAACGGPSTGTMEHPRTTDKQGRTVVSSQDAVNAFVSACYTPGGTRGGAKSFVTRNGYEVSSDDKEFFISACSNRALGVMQMEGGICSVTFDAGIPNVDAGAQAARLLIAKIGTTGIGGKKGGGQINLKTAKGTVVVGNNAQVKGNGASISLFRR